MRLLLDDNPTAGLDALWSAANRHANIEIRLFNPFTIRAPRFFNYVTDFRRLNRRMHNKSFTVDNQASIVQGGIGNHAEVTQHGTLNTARIEQRGINGSARLTHQGHGKTATIIQYGQAHSFPPSPQ